MSLLDKISATVAPLASDETRAKAHSDARALSNGNDWLSLVLDHHEKIDELFADAKSSTGVADRNAALEDLALVLTAHSIAEEAVLYPALVQAHDQGQATVAYAQQSTTKTEMFLLKGLDPTSEEWSEKLEHIISAVRQHVYQEESGWFADLAKSDDVDQAMLTKEYLEQYDRYLGDDKSALFG